MSNRAYLKLVEASKQKTISIDELKNFFQEYKENMKKTATQLSWNYNEIAFPYVISDVKDGEGKWMYLKSDVPRYKYIAFGIGTETVQQEESEDEIDQPYVEVVLPEGSTHGDKGKAIEFLKFLGEKLAGEVHLFNSRIMYFYKR